MHGTVENRKSRRHSTWVWKVAIVAALLIAAVVFITVRNCGPTSAADGEWTLLMLDGNPTLTGTEISLSLNGTGFTAHDGCNTLRTLRGGSERSKELIARTDGTFRLPREVLLTAVLCVSPPGVMEQAERYERALMTGTRYKIVEDRLEITDHQGIATLVFLKKR